MGRKLRWALGLIGLGLAGLVGPVIGTEVFCHGKPVQSTYVPLINDPKFQRPAANSYMTYPEWHIVYAYEGLAKTLESGDEYQFNYLQSILGFWRAECQLLQVADRHGGANFATRSTSYVIGPSFGLELSLKALYEDTVGALVAVSRGANKSPQDVVARDMAQDYARFLQQQPWYEYNFQHAIDQLWSAPLEQPVRGWERRLALGAEWKGKIAYAQGIKSLVAATTGDADLIIHSVVTGLSAETLKSISGVEIVSETPQGIVIKTPRYAAFNTILIEIAKRGGEIVEIAGNDNIMVTALRPSTREPRYASGIAPIIALPREGFDETRDLLEVPMHSLAGLIRQLQTGEVRLEHIYDY